MSDFVINFNKALYIIKYIFISILLSFVIVSNSLAEENNVGELFISNDIVGYEEYLNDLLAKERFLGYLSSNVKIMMTERGRKFRNDFERYEAKHGKYKQALIEDYGYEGGADGIFFNFKEKKQYDRFAEFLRYYNLKNQLSSYRTAILYNSPAKFVSAYFERELTSASKSYNIGDFRTARLQFEDIYNAYKPFYNKNLDEVLFLWAETNFALRYFAEARELYQKLIAAYPSSKKSSYAAYRMIFMDYVYDDEKTFFADYNKYKVIFENDKV